MSLGIFVKNEKEKEWRTERVRNKDRTDGQDVESRAVKGATD